jgi:hypothetical protein
MLCAPSGSRSERAGVRRNALLCVMTPGFPRSDRVNPTIPLPSRLTTER